MFLAVFAACSPASQDHSASPRVGSLIQQLGPPNWEGGTGAAVHYPPVAWPTEPSPAACGATCGQWMPYTRFGQTINDPRNQDPSNGGTSPQNYVNISSSCTDKALPSIYYYLHKDTLDPTKDVILFRWRVSQPGHNYATGPSAGSYSSSDPWSSALWTVLFNIDGSGYRQLAAHINGSSGSPSAPIDTLAGIYGKIPTQSIDYTEDPTNIKLIGTSYTGFTDQSSGKLLNFNNSVIPTTDWLNGASETTWDYGTTRARLVTTRPCVEYFIDYQIPVKLLDASTYGGPKVDRSTPISMLFCTANSLNNPMQKDCALSRNWLAGAVPPGAFGDYISFDQTEPYNQPIITEVTSTAPASCSGTYTLKAKVKDSIFINSQGTAQTSVQAVSFWYYADLDGDGTTDDSSTWTHAADATLVTGKLNEWRATWDSRGLPRGSYLIGVQALDDNTKIDDGMSPSGINNRTFSYVTSDSIGRVYVNGSWKINQSDFPSHSPSPTPSGTENWYGNPLITGIQVSGIGVDLAINSCGVAPTLTLGASPSSLAPSEVVTFTVTVDNSSNPLPATVNSLSAVLPAGFAYSTMSTAGDFGASDPSSSGTTLTWTPGSGVTVNAGASKTLIFNATASTVAGPYTAVANASTNFGTITSDPASMTVYSAKASLSETPDRYSVNPDGSSQVVYSLAYANSSPVALTSATITSSIPTNVNYVSCSGGTSCANSSGTVTWQLGSLAAGATGTVTLTVTVASAYSGTSLAHSSTLTATAPDTSTVTRTASSTISVVQPAASLGLNMSASVLRVAPGGSVTWTINYSNQGTGTANGVLLVSTLPGGFTYSSCTTSSHFTSCANASGVVTFSGTSGATISLAAGASGSVTVVATAINQTPYTYANPGVNRATISGSGGISSVDVERAVGVTGSQCDYVFYFHQGADNTLATVRPANSTPPTGTSDYKSGVSNMAATSFTSTSPAPDEIVFLQDSTFAQTTTLSGTLTVNFTLETSGGGATTRLTLKTVNANETIATTDLSISNNTNPYTYSVDVTGKTVNAGDKLKWIFQFIKPGGSRPFYLYYDSTTYNSRSSICQSTTPANLTVSNTVDKTAISGPVERLKYTIDYANVGGTDASGVVLTDVLPTGMTNCQYSSDNTNWSNCSTSSGSPQQHVFNIGALAVGGSGRVYVRGDSPASVTSGQSLVNTASITGTSLTTTTATATTTVATVASGGTPLIVVTSSADKSSIQGGETVTYTVRVVNAGTAAATSINVADTVPATSYYHYVASSISGGDSRSVSGNDLSWTISSLAVGASATLTFQMSSDTTGITSGANALDNSATASETAYCTGGSPPSGCTSNTVTVVVNGSANMTLSASRTPSAAVPGDSITYTLTVGSTGSSSASGAVVKDILPVYTQFDSIVQGTGSYNAVANRVEFTLGSLSAGSTTEVKYKVRVESVLPAGTTVLTDSATLTATNAVTRTASVSTNATAAPVVSVQASGPATMPGPAARLALVAANATLITVDRSALLEVGAYVVVNGTVAQITNIAGTKVTLATAVTGTAGTSIYRSTAYGVSYSNSTGNADATSVSVSATVPTGWKYVTGTPTPNSAPSVGAAGTVTWNTGTITAGYSGSAQLILIPTSSDSLTVAIADANVCTVSSTPGCTDTVATNVGGLSAKVATSTPSVTVGASAFATYTITLENSLGTAVTGISVTDMLPSGFSYKDLSGSIVPTVSSGIPTWSGLSVSANSSLQIQFSANIATNTGTGTYDNPIVVTAGGGVGVTGFDELVTTDEDVTVLGSGKYVAEGFIFRDRPTVGSYQNTDPGLANVVLNINNGGTPYELTTDGFGYFRQVLEAGTWTFSIPSTGTNSTTLNNLVLDSAYTAPLSLDVSTAAASSLRFGYVATAGVEHTVSVVVNGTGSVSPTSEIVEHGSTTSFLVATVAGSTLNSISGCGGSYNSGTNLFTTAAVNADCTVTADFTTIAYTVNTSSSGTGSGTISPTSATVAHGTTRTFSVSATTGSTITSVTGCGGSFDANAGVYTTGAITGACTVSAVFTLNQYAVSGTTAGTGTGSISPTSTTVNHGSTTTFTITASSGSVITSVSGCGGSFDTNTRVFTTGTVTSPCTVTAVFSIGQHTVTTTSSGTGSGNFSSNHPTVTDGSTTSITVTASIGSTVTSVSGCGGSFNSNTGVFTTATITASCTVTAVFTLNQYTVSTSKSGTGTLLPSSAWVNHGAATTVGVSAGTGWTVTSVSGCGGSFNSDTGVFTTGTMTGNCTVTATFTKLGYSLKLTATGANVNACGQSSIAVQLVDASNNPVVPSPGDPIDLTLTVSSPTGNARILQAGLVGETGGGTASVRGVLPASGATTAVVTLDAADVLSLNWSSADLSGTAGSPAQVTFQVGPVDPTTSTVVSSGTQVFAGAGSVLITVTPRDSCNLKLGPGQINTLIKDHGLLSSVQDNGDGTYTTSFTAGAGQCPANASQIAVTVNSTTIDQKPAINVVCADLDVRSPVTVVTRDQVVQACASKNEYARIRVIPRNTQNVGLASGQAVTFADSPPYLVSGGVEVGTDPSTGDATYTLLVGSNRCTRNGPYPVDIRVGGVSLTTKPMLDFACPPIEDSGVTFTASRPSIPADGATSSEVRIKLVDTCGNPGFGRRLLLRPNSSAAVRLSSESATTADDFGGPDDGVVVLDARSGSSGVTGVGFEVDARWHDSTPALISFYDPQFYFGGKGFGCSTVARTRSGGWWWIGLALALVSRRRRGAK